MIILMVMNMIMIMSMIMIIIIEMFDSVSYLYIDSM
jgi:hypothetical protein